MNPYLIEIRLVGRIKYDILNLVGTVNHKFETNVHKMVPHITLLGPFQTARESKLIKDFESVCKKTELILYTISGTDLFSKSGVVYLDVTPNEALEKFRTALCTQLKNYCKLSYWDFQEPFRFHITIATRVENRVVDEILKYINSCKPLAYETPLLRVTLLKNGKTLCEYDFKLKRKLEKWELINYMQNRESIASYFNDINNELRKKPRVFFTSDLHLNDKYALDSACRPFSNLEMMNSTLVNNWNSEVTDNDTVYYIGDLANKHANSEELDFWLSQLKGHIVFIKGDKDRENLTLTTTYKEYEIEYSGRKFFLVHSPENIPDDVLSDPEIWTIHGHTQNRRLNEYPFINHENRTINVSTDLTNFRPIPVEEILSAIKTEPKAEGYRLIGCETEKLFLFREKLESF